MKEMHAVLSPGSGFPLLLIPEYSGINEEQRIQDRSKRAHRKPVKCFLTKLQIKTIRKKISKGFQKETIEFATCQQLFYSTYTDNYRVYIVLGIISNLEMI